MHESSIFLSVSSVQCSLFQFFPSKQKIDFDTLPYSFVYVFMFKITPKNNKEHATATSTWVNLPKIYQNNTQVKETCSKKKPEKIMKQLRFTEIIQFRRPARRRKGDLLEEETRKNYKATTIYRNNTVHETCSKKKPEKNLQRNQELGRTKKMKKN